MSRSLIGNDKDAGDDLFIALGGKSLEDLIARVFEADEHGMAGLTPHPDMPDLGGALARIVLQHELNDNVSFVTSLVLILEFLEWLLCG